MLYVGHTSDLPRRLFEHKLKLAQGFTQRYNITTLVYFEVYTDRETAEKREQQLKGWSRSRKLELIESLNPTWSDLGFRFIYPEAKAVALLESFRNRNLNGVQLCERAYGSVPKDQSSLMKNTTKGNGRSSYE